MSHHGVLFLIVVLFEMKFFSFFFSKKIKKAPDKETLTLKKLNNLKKSLKSLKKMLELGLTQNRLNGQVEDILSF